MNIRSLLFVASLGLLSTGFAENTNNHHFHAKAKTSAVAPANQNAMAPGACEIEIINDSFDNINVYGRFDDGSTMPPFSMEYWGKPHYVSLFYYGTCHTGMDFYIETVNGKHKYNGYTPVGKTIRITTF